MEISTINTLIGVTASLFTGLILLVLGAVVAYVRNINKNIKDILVMSTETKTKAEIQGKQIDVLFERVHKLERA